VSDPDALCWGRSCETEWPESVSSIGRAGKEKSTDDFRFRKGLLPEGDMRGEMRGDIFVGERLLFFGLLPWLLEAGPVIPDSEYSRLLPYPTALPAMLPNDPFGAKSSEEPLRGRVEGSALLLLLFEEGGVVFVASAVVPTAAAGVGAFCSCCSGAAGDDFTRGEAVFEAMGKVDCGT